MAFSIDEKQEGGYEAKSSQARLLVVLEMLMLLDEVLIVIVYIFFNNITAQILFWKSTALLAMVLCR